MPANGCAHLQFLHTDIRDCSWALYTAYFVCRITHSECITQTVIQWQV